jgi:hypothetical protein
MTNCQDIFTFLTGVSNRNVATTLPDADLATLQQLNMIQRLTSEEYAQLTQQLQTVSATRAAIAQESAGRAQLANAVQEEDRRTHSILFHFENQEKQSAETQKEAQDQAALRSTDADLASRIQAFNQLVAQQSTLDTLSPYAGGYVGLTGAGVLQLRQLGIRLYRVSDLPFSAYWAEARQVDQDLNNLALLGSQYVAGLSSALSSVDKSYLWAIGLGLAKLAPDPTKGGPMFLDAYHQIGSLAHNDENRLMSAELLSTLRQSVAENVPILADLDKQVRSMGVPKESSLGVASMMLLGRRADGTFATGNLPTFLRLTRSYESAALLAIVNQPIPQLQQKFSYLRAVFASWGYEPSEDVELSSAYLTVSDLPADRINTKLAIITRGLHAYLQYPLVASAILAAIPVMEANETLNLLEQAYEVVGRRAMPMTPPELITLAVRMVHGVRPQTIQNLDTTATATAAPVAAAGGYYYGPGFFFVPIFIAHGAYFSTYSGIGGAHPGHAHMGGGGFSG